MKGFYNSIRFKKETIRFFCENTRLIIMSFFLLLGVLFGVICFKNNWFSAGFNAADSFSGFYLSRSQMSKLSVFANSLSSNLIYLALCCFCSFHLFGKPLSFAIPFVKGLGLGCVCSAAYSALGVGGIAFCALIILPGGFISSVGLIFACLSAGDFSGEIYSRIFYKSDAESGERVSFREFLKKYSIKNIKYILVMILSSITECAVTSLFLSAFSM